jgi:hypothetical protein
MKLLNPLLVALVLTSSVHPVSAGGSPPPAATLPNVFCADPKVLSEAKAKFASGDVSLKPVFHKLLRDADKALQTKPELLTDKKQTPPSGDKRDYVSQAPYYWPNPRTANGLPYIRKDGERNPAAREDSDGTRFVHTASRVQTLALAFYLTGKEDYAARAAELLRAFFLNPSTRMNPNLNFGQGIPGSVEGRGGGLIDVRGMTQLIDSLKLLEQSHAWTLEDRAAMSAWLGSYLEWLTTSKNGRHEADAVNNHGNYYDAQLVALALFAGQTNLATKTLSQVRTKRIAKQIEPDGRQPLELARTKSFSYSMFSLNALMDLASLGKNQGLDLWHYQTDDGRGIRKALEFLLPYADPARKWPYQQIEKIKRADLGELLLRAAGEYPDEKFAAALKYFSTDELAVSRVRLLFKTAPLKTGSADTAMKPN